MPAMVRRRRCPDVGAALQRYERPAGARVQRTARACVEQSWRHSIAEALAVIDLLDERIALLHEELRPFAAADPRVPLLRTIPGIGEPLGLTIAAEIGDIARFGSPRKLLGYSGLAPRINQSGDRSRTGALSKANSRTLRWAAVEAADQAWRPTNPWHELYTQLAARAAPILSPQAAAAFWPPDDPACN